MGPSCAMYSSVVEASPSPIGQAFRESRTALVTALAIAAIALVGDFMWSAGLSRQRILAGVGVSALLLAVAGGDRKSLGLTLLPLQGFGYWVKMTLVAGAIVVLFSVVAFGALRVVGIELDTRPIFSHPSQFGPDLWNAVVLAPILEEPIYRLILCAPLVAVAGRVPTIIVSGLLFGYVHFHYGNPGPDNFIAGYILAWAYLKSGSLLLPILLHALGNLCVVVANIAHYYYVFG